MAKLTEIGEIVEMAEIGERTEIVEMAEMAKQIRDALMKTSRKTFYKTFTGIFVRGWETKFDFCDGEIEL